MVDHVVLATGYKPDLANVPYLRPLLDRIETADGFPVLDEHFQTSVPGLFMPGFVATRDFGPSSGSSAGARRRPPRSSPACSARVLRRARSTQARIRPARPFRPGS